MKKNIVLEKIKCGEPVFGFGLVSGSPLIAELVAHAGFDWIWIDTQHGYWDENELLAALQVIFPTDTTPIVRPGSNEFYRIGRLLDAGAEGVIVPMVNSPEEAAAAVLAARYPPAGGRSGGGARLSLFGDDYFERANDEVLVAVMIETTQALAVVDEIAAVPGVDCLFIGPGDLRFSMQTQPGSAEHEAAIARILDAANSAGIFAGFPCGAVEEAIRRADQGFKLVTCTSDLSTLRSGLTSVLEALGR